VKKISILVLLISMSFTYANMMDPNVLVNALEENHLLNTADQCAEPEAEDHVYKCVESLCGAPNPENSAFLTGDKLANLYDQSIEDQFSSDLETFKDSAKASADYSKALLLEMKKREGKLEFSSVENTSMINNEIIPHLDVVMLEDGNINLGYDQMDQLSPDQQDFMKNYLSHLKKNAKDDFYLSYQLGLPVSIENLKTELSELIKEVTEYPEQSQDLNGLVQGLAWVQGKAFKYNPTPKYVYNLASYLTNLRSQILPLMNKKPHKDFCSNLKCEEFVKKVVLPKKAEQLKSYEEMVDKIDEDKVDEVAKKCLGTYYYDKIEKKYISTWDFNQNSQKRVLDYVKEKYSKETFEYLSNYMSFDMTVKTDEKDFFGQSGVMGIKRTAQQEAGFKKSGMEKLKTSSDFDLISSFGSQFYYDRPVMSSLQMQCGSDMSEILPIINDHYQPIFDLVKLSHFTCEHPNIGQDIYAHELGHVFSELLSRGSSSDESKNDFQAKRKCVNSLYLLPDYKGAFSKKHPEDHFRSEEDMADFFAANVSNFNEKDSDKRTISMCALLPVVGDRYDNVSTENRDYDNHSAGFIRIVREAYFKGVELGESCQKVIDKNRHLWQFQDCNK